MSSDLICTPAKEGKPTQMLFAHARMGVHGSQKKASHVDPDKYMGRRHTHAATPFNASADDWNFLPAPKIRPDLVGAKDQEMMQT